MGATPAQRISRLADANARLPIKKFVVPSLPRRVVAAFPEMEEWHKLLQTEHDNWVKAQNVTLAPTPQTV